jgi:hypothetical protein
MTETDPDEATATARSAPGSVTDARLLAAQLFNETWRLLELEALARAHAIAGDTAQARHYTDRALSTAQDIAEDDERELVLADLETIPAQPRYW